MPITDTVDMLTASGGTAALTGVIAVVGGEGFADRFEAVEREPFAERCTGMTW